MKSYSGQIVHKDKLVVNGASYVYRQGRDYDGLDNERRLNRTWFEKEIEKDSSNVKNERYPRWTSL